MKIAVILPSRGLMFSRTAEELLRNLRGVNHKIFFSHRRPIPECFEAPTVEALKDKDVTHLWFVEDDMILPDNVFWDMYQMDKAVVTANYPTTEKGNAAVLSVKGRVVYGGTGCLLVQREVFNELRPPYWRTDIRWKPKNLGDCIRFSAHRRTDKPGYGYHDVNFYMNLFKLNIPVHVLPYTLGQRKLVALGRAGTNQGAHQIEEWREVEADRYDSLIKNLPKEKPTGLVEVATKDGVMNCTPDHAEKLVQAGLGTYPPKKPVVLDWGDCV